MSKWARLCIIWTAVHGGLISALGQPLLQTCHGNGGIRLQRPRLSQRSSELCGDNDPRAGECWYSGIEAPKSNVNANQPVTHHREESSSSRRRSWDSSPIVVWLGPGCRNP